MDVEIKESDRKFEIELRCCACPALYKMEMEFASKGKNDASAAQTLLTDVRDMLLKNTQGRSTFICPECKSAASLTDESAEELIAKIDDFKERGFDKDPDA